MFKTVAALQQTARMKPTGPVLFLLGKAQMKAGLLHEAIKNFNQALEVMVIYSMHYITFTVYTEWVRHAAFNTKVVGSSPASVAVGGVIEGSEEKVGSGQI